MLAKWKYLICSLLISVLASCQNTTDSVPEFHSTTPKQETIVKVEDDTIKYSYVWQASFNYKTALINQISPPKGFKRVLNKKTSFGAWLQHLPLKENNTVYLFNGEEKYNQSAQYKVIDIDVGTKDLQQCADAVMRLRAEYLYASNQKEKIHFNYTNGANIPFSKWSSGLYPSLKNNKVVWVSSSNNESYKSFKKYINNIFMYAGTASLEKELQQVDIQDIEIGDVFIKGGFPGHAVIVVDVATNESSEKCFMVAQSYMPAQNIHILKNPNNSSYSPWYVVSECSDIIETPEWTFYPNQLKRFKQ